jgi:hypothetical protein
MQNCPTCGQIIPPEVCHIFPRIGHKRTIYELLRRRLEGVTAEIIKDVMYSNDPNGGRESNTLGVILSEMRKELKPHGLTINCGSGPGGIYRLTTIEGEKS